MPDFQKHAAVFLFFALAAAFFTAPLVLHPGSFLRGSDIDALGDPLFNTWVIAHNADRISRLDFAGFFDGPVFYPQNRTLLYSETLLPQSLMALPGILVSGNPVLGYNLVFLLGFMLSGFGMYCLARHLTKSVAAGIAAGFIYAFSPFMLAHTYHIQIVSAWGIPFAFLYLHKFYESGKLKEILLFAFFYIVQSLANGYYALFLTFFAAAWSVFMLASEKKCRDRRRLAYLGSAAGLSALALGPVFLLYAKAHAEMGFSRNIDFFAKLSSYLGVPQINILYGKLFSPFFQPEGELFPGVIAFVLGVIGIVSLRRSRRTAIPPGAAIPRWTGYARRILNVLIGLASVFLVFIMGQGGIEWHVSGFRIFRVHSLERTLAQWAVLVALRILLDVVVRVKRTPDDNPERKILGGYAATLFLAFLFTFGPNGPYNFLYRYVPGFQAIRVSARFQIFVMFSLAVLAAFGLRTFLRRFGKPAAGTAIAALAVGLIGLEFLSIPIPYSRIPAKDKIPGIYKTLAADKQPGVLVELPLPPYNTGTGSIEALRMYFALFHRKTLVNGYSGYFPPLYTELCRRQEFHSIDQLLDDFQALTVRYVLLHYGEMAEGVKTDWTAKTAELKGEMTFVAQEGEDSLYALIPRPSRSGRVPSFEGFKKLPRSGWTVRASANETDTPRLLDGDSKTRWDGGPQKPGDFLEIDTKTSLFIRRMSLTFGPSCFDFPRGYRVETSLDGKEWVEAAREDQTVVPILAFAKPKAASIDVAFAARPARYIRITNLGSEPIYHWSIHELDLYE